MKRLIFILMVGALAGLTPVAMAGDYHTGTTLICSDCHVAHYSQAHGYAVGDAVFPALGPSGPYDNLLRNETNDLCLSCHNQKSWAPDVFGANVLGTTVVRRAGALNAAAGHLANDAGYDDIDGHTLWSTSTAPGGTWSHSGVGLECTDCHSQHGQNAWQYRNLQYSTSSSSMWFGDSLTYAVGSNVLTKDIFEHSAAAYTDADVDYNEPATTKSFYGQWCSSCHTHFHGSGGTTDMGGQSGGFTLASPIPWKRHPTADVNIGHAGSASYISSLSQFNSHANRVKVMDSQGLWNGTTGDNTVTPSCMSCHRSHGDKNAFGLIFMTGSGTTITEEGDGGVYKDLCRQCHIQGG